MELEILNFTEQNFIKEIKNLLFNYLNFKFNKIEIPKKNSLTAILFKILLNLSLLKKT